jgi:WD40 repeat protein
MTALIDQFTTFVTELSEMYPDDADFDMFLTTVKLIKSSNPSLIASNIYENTVQYEERILNKDEKFFLENTFDEHEDKVWTSCSNLNDDSTFFSGGSDSKFIIWKDFTEQTENDRLKAEEDNLLLEQQMNNDIRNKRYGEVIHQCFINLVIRIKL